ncbi:MAG: selenocysteine-specific translation elongation factor [Polyangiales bacterium]
MTARPSDLVIGVAGHIDHGKTALVKALTGVDTDRLPEEKSRGITIELGFAHLELPGGRRAAIVDMPGHERFIRAMIAGAGGLDLCMLVVAANEGVMPQTREHLAVAELVGVRAGVIALSKSDLAADDVLELAIEEVRETVAGTFLQNAEIVAVSAHTGRGLDELRAALARAAVAPRASDGPTLLPIDRVFVRKGFGTVVTGTLVSGAVGEGDSLVVAPVGLDDEAREVRVRALQIHGDSVTQASAGTRVAVNIAGIESGEVPRGAWLMREGEVALTYAFDAEVSLLASTRHELGRRSKLELAVGAAHTLCAVALLEGESLEPGSKAIARITTESAVALRPNERFVLRGPPSLAGFGSTLGGGVVIRPVAERVKKRDTALARAKSVAENADDRDARLRAESDAAGLKGLSPQQLSARVGATLDEAAMATAGLVQITRERWVSASAAAPVTQKILQSLSAEHSANPASRGLTRSALKALGDDALMDALLAKLVADRKVSRDQDVYARAGWKPKDPDAVPHLEPVRKAICSAGVMPPRVDEVAQSLRVEPKALAPALDRLVARGDIVKISPEFYADAASMLELEKKLVAWIEAQGSIDAQGFKTITGASRKWTIPLAEYFDVKKVTIRIGDARKLRAR